MEFRKHHHRLPQHLLSIPFIYGVFFPAALLDIGIEIYHRICFPLYGLPYVKRSQYIRVDRQRLSYLRWYEKINCAYCGYMNGLFYYISRIGSETEHYWCGIKHQKGGDFIEQPHQVDFLPYGDEQKYRAFVSGK